MWIYQIYKYKMWIHKKTTRKKEAKDGKEQYKIWIWCYCKQEVNCSVASFLIWTCTNFCLKDKVQWYM